MDHPLLLSDRRSLVVLLVPPHATILVQLSLLASVLGWKTEQFGLDHSGLMLVDSTETTLAIPAGNRHIGCRAR